MKKDTMITWERMKEFIILKMNSKEDIRMFY